MRIKALKVIVPRLLVGLLVGVGGVAGAEECAVRTDKALAELRQVFPGMGEAQAADAERILAELCVTAEPTTTRAAEATTQTEADTPSMLGVEFNKAEPDSKGHSRLRKTH